MWTQEDSLKMDRASEEAKEELDNLLETKGQDASAKDIIIWYAKWFMKAGHKRLGRQLVALAKRLV